MSTTNPTAPTSRTPLPMAGPTATTPPLKTGIDYELFLDCVHCGLCTASCPTYLELGTEMDSPRGRIYLMRAVTDGRLELNDDVRGHLDLCLDCRACETACPSGVQYGKLIEPFRAAMHAAAPNAGKMPWVQRQIMQHIFPYAGRNKLALAPARWLQWAGLDRMMEKTGALNLLPKPLRQMHDMLPTLKAHYGKLPEFLPAEGPRRARVGLFVGCVADGVYPETTVATAKVLQKNGCDVVIPRAQGCCGALHYHSGMEAPAREFAAANCTAFGTAPGSKLEPLDAIVVNAAGCGAMLKEYDHLTHGTPGEPAATAFKAKVRDVSEFLADLRPVEPTHPVRLKATYHDACHLCHAQQIRKQPRQLLGMIPGLDLVPLAESEICCGAAGSYNLTQPEMADRLGKRKAANILATGAEAVFTGNVGCLLQVSRHLRPTHPDLLVAHPIDALWASYAGHSPTKSRPTT